MGKEPPPTKRPKLKQTKNQQQLNREEDKQETEEDNEEDEEQDWTKRFSGLWQFQKHDLHVEKAFNMLMSFGRSQCCICALFVSPSPFQGYQHRRLMSSVKCLTAREKAKKKFGVGGLKVSRKILPKLIKNLSIEKTYLSFCECGIFSV